MKVAVLTGGGDCPGVNAALRAVLRRGEQRGYQLIGIRDGWRGLVDDNHFPLTRDLVSGILHLGGTILGTSRTNPLKREGGLDAVKSTLERNRIEAVIVLGGEDTLGVAKRLFDEGIPVLGIPKTIDNDLMGTDFTFGFDTAVAVATEAIDRLHSTAEAHSRVMICEVMGRHTGHIALHSGLAAGADVILVPERPIQIEEVCGYIRQRQSRGKRFSIVVVAEGAHVARSGERTLSEELDEFGHARLGGIGNYLTREIEKRTKIETRVTVLGHIQRGGMPTARDRILATRLGLFAADMVHRKSFGKMAALRGDEIVEVSLAEATRELRQVDPALYAAAEVFFG